MLIVDLPTIGAIASMITAVVALAGLILIVPQLRQARAASQLAAKAARSQLYGAVAAGMYTLNDFLKGHPEMVGYLYEGTMPASPDDPTVHGLIELMCDEFMDFVDSVTEQRRSLPAGMDWSTWDSYFRDVYAASSVLRGWLDRNIAYYPDYTLGPLGFIVVRDARDGLVLKRLIASKGDDAGSSEPTQMRYPWVARWDFHEYLGPDERGPLAATMTVAVPKDRHATVVVATPVPESDPRILETLRSWVVDTMRGVGIDRVDFKAGRESWRYNLRRLGLSGDRVFELPLYMGTRIPS